MNKSDADRLLAALPSAKNLDLGDYIPKRNEGEAARYIAAQMQADAEEARRYDDPMYGYQPSPNQLYRIARSINSLSIEEFTLFEQEIGTRFARKLLLWSIRKCQRKAQKSPISMAALSAAIMPSGLEEKSWETSAAAAPEMKPLGN